MAIVPKEDCNWAPILRENIISDNRKRMGPLSSESLELMRERLLKEVQKVKVVDKDEE